MSGVKLWACLQQGHIVVACGCFEMISGKLVEEARFKAVSLSGDVAVPVHLGSPDVCTAW